MPAFDAPESAEDARLQALLREAMAGEGPDVSSAVLDSSPARRRAACQRATGSRSQSRSRSARLLQAALMLLGAGAVAALAVMRWQDERVQAGRQDPQPAESAILEVASREHLQQLLKQVESVSLQAARPVPEMAWRVTITRLDGLVGVLSKEQRVALVRALEVAKPATSSKSVWRFRAYLDLELRGHRRVVVPVYAMADGLSLDLGGAGLVSLPRGVAGLAELYKQLDQRAQERWAYAVDDEDLAAAPNTLEELHCSNVDARSVAKALRRMPALRRLHLWKVHADAELVEQIAGCALLEALTLVAASPPPPPPPPEEPFDVDEDAAFAPHSLRPLESLRSLHRLHVAGRPVDPADLARLSALRDLGLDRCPLRAPGLSLIAALPLTRCALSNSMAPGEDLERALSGFARVQRLLLSFGPHESRAAVRGVAGLRQLRELKIASQPYWDKETLDAIAALPGQMPWAKVTSANQ